MYLFYARKIYYIQRIWTTTSQWGGQNQPSSVHMGMQDDAEELFAHFSNRDSTWGCNSTRKKGAISPQLQRLYHVISQLRFKSQSYTQKTNESAYAKSLFFHLGSSLHRVVGIGVQDPGVFFSSASLKSSGIFVWHGMVSMKPTVKCFFLPCANLLQNCGTYTYFLQVNHHLFLSPGLP